ncbi:MAG: hypothetical protein DRP51_05255 [Candidatus Zixiibacteriota bacterium]|nr:MAG: hypothetical protein DRP51_05255 [candidate division Zixibacteria bacterium]HHI02125.1 hypothetical protein [candidate division Zixibacteria bacterium]
MFIPKQTRLMTTLLVISIFALVFLVGCSKAPTAPDNQKTTTLLKRSFAASKILGESAYTETIISADKGGAITLHDVELYFPPDALDSDTLIFVNIPDLSVFANDFGTEGLIFNVPVRVTMNYRDADLSGINETSIKMAWFNEGTGMWDIIDCTLDQANKQVIAEVEHFSAYALITDEQ